MAQAKDGPVEVKRCAMVDYTEIVIILEKEENMQSKDKVKRGNSFTSKRAPWYLSKEPDAYNPDNIWNLDKNINTIADIKQFTNKSMKDLKTHLKVKCILLAKLTTMIYNTSTKAFPRAQPRPTGDDHCNADNPSLCRRPLKVDAFFWFSW